MHYCSNYCFANDYLKTSRGTGLLSRRAHAIAVAGATSLQYSHRKRLVRNALSVSYIRDSQQARENAGQVLDVIDFNGYQHVDGVFFGI